LRVAHAADWFLSADFARALAFLPREADLALRRGRRLNMAADGTWNIVMNTPMGDRQSTVALKEAGATLTGTQSADGESAEIFEGTVNGGNVAWKVSITSPMPMTLSFTGTVSDDSMSGQMQAGAFGSFPFSGSRT
jgi:hypothetical protein